MSLRCEFFARRVSELSENKFQIQVFAAGKIVPGLQVLDAVQNGTVECGHTSPYELINEFHKGYGTLFLPAGNTNCQMGGWYRKEITSEGGKRSLCGSLGKECVVQARPPNLGGLPSFRGAPFGAKRSEDDDGWAKA